MSSREGGSSSRCPSCGADAAPDQRFCIGCGTSLTSLICPTCATPVPHGARFCGQCGGRLVAADAAPPGVVVASPQGTERRLVSVLFADLVGYTSRAETEDPEFTREFLTAYFDRAAEIVGRYGGTVEKFIGDAVMAVWGTPAAREDDAELAVRAALDLVTAVRDLDRGTEARAAVTTGEAAVDRSADGQALVTGDLVNTSSRLQSVASPSTVLVDRTTMNAAGRAVVFEAAGAFELKGRTTPVEAWTAERVVATRGGGDRREVLEPPLVGRGEELRVLREALHATGRERTAHLVTAIGQAGLDKSRLAWELKKYTDGLVEPVYWHEGRSPAYGEGVAFWALSQMVRSRCRIIDTDEPEVIRHKLTATLAEFVERRDERDWMEPHLETLLGVAEAPAGGRDEMFAAWRLFFERISIKGTVVMVFDDLHRAEESLFDFIEHLLEWATACPILVVALARPELLERRSGWGAGPVTSTTIHLRPLPDEAMADLLRGMVPGLPDVAIDSIVGRAEGVPLYAVEIVRMLLDSGALVRHGERYRLVEDAALESVPATLQALVAARLDALAADERRLVQDAAVLGRSFPVSGLIAMSGTDAAALEPLLRRLVRAEILSRDPVGPGAADEEYAFVQSLFREVAYANLSLRDRAERHSAAARFLESLEDDEVAGLIASHYLDAYEAAPEGSDRTDARTRAQASLVAAAERSINVHANGAAVSFVEQALAITQEDEDRARLWVLAGAPARAAHGAAVASRYLRQAIEWYLAQGRMAEADDVIARLVVSHASDDDLGELLPLVEAAVGRIDDDDPAPSAPRLLAGLGGTYLYLDRVDEAVAPIERGLILAERLSLDEEIADLFTMKAWLMGVQGRQHEAALLGEGALRLLEGRGELAGELRARINTSNAYIASEPARGLEIAGRGIELAERIGDAEHAAYLAGNEGVCAILLGRWETPIRRALELERPHIGAFARLGLAGPALIARAHTGQLDGDPMELLESIDAADLDGAQRDSVLGAMGALAFYAAGHLEEVETAAVRAGQGTTNPMESALAYCAVARAQAWLGQRDRLAATIERLTSWTGIGEVIRASLLQARAALAAMDGEVEQAERDFRSALSVWRRLGMLPDVATTELEMLRLLDDDLADRETLSDDVVAVIDELGSVTLRRRLEELRGVLPAFEVVA